MNADVYMSVGKTMITRILEAHVGVELERTP